MFDSFALSLFFMLAQHFADFAYEFGSFFFRLSLACDVNENA